MSSVWGIIFIILLLVIWIIAGGYITQANVYLTPLKNTDDLFNQAYNYTFWGAFITWSLIAIFILIIILAIFGVVALFGSGAGEEESIYSKVYKQYQQNKQPEQEGMSWLTIIFLFIAVVLLSITGILAAISADDMTRSHSFDENNNNIAVAYNDCVIAAILSLVSVGLLVLAVIAYLFIGFLYERHKTASQVSVTPVQITPVEPAAAIPTVMPIQSSRIPTVTPVQASRIPIVTPVQPVQSNRIPTVMPINKINNKK